MDKHTSRFRADFMLIESNLSALVRNMYKDPKIRIASQNILAEDIEIVAGQLREADCYVPNFDVLLTGNYTPAMLQAKIDVLKLSASQYERGQNKLQETALR